jgi:ERG2 and Sigma1 receptor like protein
MAYLFDPEVLSEIVRTHLGLPVERQIEAVTNTLCDVYGAHVHPGQPWMFSNAGGVMCTICPLHVSWNEYLLFAGTAVGSEGHSGRHRADMFDFVLSGELWTYGAGSLERTVHQAGEMAHLPRGSSNGSKLRPGVWLLEYARGNIASLFPFALADTLFSTLDSVDLIRQLTTSTKLVAREAVTRLEEWRSGARFRPNLERLRAEAPRAERARIGRRRIDLN